MCATSVLENIKRIMLERYSEKQLSKDKAGTTTRPEKGKPKKGVLKGGSSDRVPKKARFEKFCQHCKTEAIQKSQKKATKGKYDSISDSNSEQKIGSGDTGLGRDKHLKLDKPIGQNLMSTTACPIKVTTIACPDQEGFRDIENTKIFSKTGKVTAVVAVMTIFNKHKKLAQC